MGFIDRFEKRLERLVTGAFTKTFKSELQPVEIAAAIKAEMDAKASIVSRDRILAPNAFTVRLSSLDFDRLKKILGDALLTELTDQAKRHANLQNFQFAGELAINLVEDGGLDLGELKVKSQSQEVKVAWVPALEVNGQRYILTQARTTVGRDTTADIAINDTSLSRKHFEILWDGQNAAVKDLGSTNGTVVNGRPVTEVAIAGDTEILAGRLDFTFKVLATS